MNRLPLEVKARIASHLDRKDASQLSRADKAWHEAAAASLWTEMILQENDFTSDIEVAQQWARTSALRRQPHLCILVKTIKYDGHDGSVLPLLADTLELVGPYLTDLNFSWSNEYDDPKCLKYFRLRLLELRPLIKLRKLRLCSSPSPAATVLHELLAMAPNLDILDIDIEPTDGDDMQGANVSKWPAMPNVTRMIVNIFGCGYETVIELIEKCPNLVGFILHGVELEDFDDDQDLNLDMEKTDHSIIERLELPITGEAARHLASIVLHRLCDSPRLTTLSLVAYSLNEFDQTVFTIPTLETIIIWNNNKNTNAFPILTTTASQYLGYFRRHPSLCRILVSPMHASVIGYRWEEKMYNAILLRSYFDPISRESLYHFRYTTTQPRATDNQEHCSQANTLDKISGWRLRYVRWTSWATFKHKPVSPTLLSEVYAMIDQPERWKDPNRDLKLPQGAWTILLDSAASTEESK